MIVSVSDVVVEPSTTTVDEVAARRALKIAAESRSFMILNDTV